MTIENNLKLLALSEEFSIKEIDERYEVTYKNSECGLGELTASYEPYEGWRYYLTGCYNSGVDWLEIDIPRLVKLQRFCKALGDSYDN